jgi:hypothetical protein
MAAARTVDEGDVTTNPVHKPFNSLPSKHHDNQGNSELKVIETEAHRKRLAMVRWSPAVLCPCAGKKTAARGQLK